MALRDDAQTVLQTLRNAGHVAYFAGGCVRDLLLNQTPKDYDVATDAPPDRVRGLFRSTQAVGQAFGVILVRQGRSVIEVATFRSDGDYTDGRRPDSVRFATAEEDARRRDFTINGLFLDPMDGRVIDHVNGQADLHARVIRTIGDPNARFGEDFLRLLRAVRFAARLGFTIDPKTEEAIRRHAGSLKRISPERIADELRRMLTPTTRSTAFALLGDLGLLEVILRLVPDRPTANIFPLVQPGEPISFGLAMASLVIDPTSPPTPERVRKLVQAMRQTLKISNDEADDLAGSLSFGRLLEGEPAVATMKRFLARPTSTHARALMAAISQAGFLSARIEPTLQRLEEIAKTEVAPPPLVTGDDLVTAGLQPGRAFKRILDTLYDEQLEGRLTDRSAALAMALSMARSEG